MLFKYKAIDSGSVLIANIIADVIFIISAILAFLFASFTLAFYLSEVLNSFWAGFGCVALLYLLIALVIKLNKRGIEKPIADALVRKMFKK